MNGLPPLPPGFVLDDEPQASGGMPPLPPGFEMIEDEAEQPKFGGVGMNAASGLNDVLYGAAGAPVDIVRGAMNLGVRGVNAVAGTDIPLIPDDSFGGSKSIARGMGAIRPELDPANTIADTTPERIARGVGQGAAGTILPAAAVGAASRAGAQVSPLVQAVAGRSNSVSAVGADALAGAAAGAGASAAMEVAPDKYDPVAGLAGGIVGGGLGALATGIPGLAKIGTEGVRDFAAPLTDAGRQRLAGERLRDAASDPAALRSKLENDAAPIVPGSEPTTFQQTGDMGVGALERDMQTRYPADFQDRRAAQNTARVGALESIAPTGAVESVSKAFRAQLKEIEDTTQADLDLLQRGARGRADMVGTGQTPDAAGETMRTALQRRRDLAVARENKLWGAVDPDGKLALPAPASTALARGIAKTLPKSAKPPSGEEAAVYDVLRQYGRVVPFSELAALRSRVSTALADERGRHGKSQTWARLSQIRGAIEDDIANAVDTRSAEDAAAVRAGRMRPEETIEARLQAVNAPSVGEAVFTPSGRRVDVRYELVEADSLVTSSGSDGRPNPSYPAGLQPRDRNRAASDAQVAGMARGLQPERLGASTSASEGAPIIGPDGIVESGNGRTMAIRQAYAEGGGTAKAYRDYLQAQGYDASGFRNPVLVRRRTSELTDDDRVRFGQEANASSSLTMSASEQAATDASRVNGNLLGLYRGGDVGSAENRDFVRAFLQSVPDRGQEGSFVTADGSLSLDGAQRVRNALLQSAYRDSSLVAALADEGDENIRAFGRALTDLSGDVARLRAGVDNGEIDAGADVSAAIIEAARIVQSARARGVRLPDALAQQDAFSQASPEAVSVLQIAYGDGLSGRLSREKLGNVMRSVISEAEQQVAGARLFGNALDAATILQGAKTRYGNATVAAEIPVGPGNAGTGGSEIRTGARGPGRDEGGQAGAPYRGGAQDRRILEQPEPEPNFDRAAQERLNRATQATRERANTFDNRTVGPTLARPADHAPYNMEDARVAARVFGPGPNGFNRVQRFRETAGTGKAMAAVEGYAVDRLRRHAMQDDGTLDPRKVEQWRRAHADALRALPDLDGRIQDAGRAADALAEAATARKLALDNAQKGAFGALIRSDNPQDVTRTVGQIFERRDATLLFEQFRERLKDNPEGMQGLRKAAADHITTRLIGNTEVATSGQAGIKSDQFQTFVRQNEAALRRIFSEEEVGTMKAVAEDLQRANRSLTAVRIPNQSNTAQDQRSILQRMVEAGSENWLTVAGGTAGATVAGPAGALAGGGGAAFLNALRQNGINNVDELVRDALLDPKRARMLLAKLPANDPVREEAMLRSLARRYVKAATASTLVDEDERGPMRLPERMPPRLGERRPTALEEALAGR